MNASEIEIKNITSEEYLLILRLYSLHSTVFHVQHPAWLEVKKTWSKEILGFFYDRKLIAGLLALYRRPSRYVDMSLMYVPGGIITNDMINFGVYLSCLKKYASQNHITSLYYSDFNTVKKWSNETVHSHLYGSKDQDRADKIDSIENCEILEKGAVIENLLKSLRFKPNLIGDFEGYNARYVVTIDLKQGIDSIYSNFSTRWKRSIKKAQKNDVSVVRVDKKELPNFYSLYRKTAVRGKFIPRQSSYFNDLVDYISIGDGIDYRLYITYFKNQPISSALILDTDNYSCYLYGGSDENTCGNIRGSHLMHYTIMQDSISEQKNIYDLKGIPNKLHNSAVEGLTHFKIGSGGEVLKYVGEWQNGISFIKHKLFSTALKVRSMLH